MTDYNLKTPKAAEAVVGAYQKVEDVVVGTYKKIENGVVGTYKKIEGKFVDAFLEEVPAAEAQDASSSDEDNKQ